MGIGIGTIVIVDGAILAWAVDASAGPSAQTIGYVLLGLGGIVVVLSLSVRRLRAARGRHRPAGPASRNAVGLH